MKHVRFFFLIMVTVLAFFVSCKAEVKEPEPVELSPIDVFIDIVEEKSLTSDHDRQVECFVISSKIISATQKDFPIIGEFENLKVERGSGAYPATAIALGKHTQGLWEFHVQAITRAGNIMYYGSAEKYISEGSAVNGATSVSVDLVPYLQGTGTLSINYFRSMALSDPKLVVEYQVLNSNTWVTLLNSKGPEVHNYACNDEHNGYMTYTASNLTLDTGAYKVKITLYNGDEIFSGELMDIYIFEGKNTNLAGEFSVSGMASYIPIDPGQTIKFTEAAERIGVPEGKIIKGFYALGGDSTTSVNFNPYYINNTSSIVYLMPMFDDQSTYFDTSVSGAAVTITSKSAVSSLQYIAFSSTYSTSPTIIGDNTFYQKSGLKALYAPTVTSIKSSAFSGATSLMDLDLGALVEVGSAGFYSCTSLTECPTFASSVSLGSTAFSYSGIATVDIPASASIGGNVFQGCINLRTASVSVKTIPDLTFYGCSALTYVELKNTEIIKSYAFYGCSLLQTPVIPETIYEIETSAFMSCSSMTGIIDIPQAIGTGSSIGTREVAVVNTTPIGSDAFYGTNLNEIYIDRMYGDIDVSDIGTPSGCNITFWGYYLYFDANNPNDNTTRIATYNPITSRNGILLTTEQPESVMDSNGISIKAIAAGDPPVYQYVYTSNNAAVGTNDQNHPRVQRIVAYNVQLGKTRDGYPLPIPTREGFAFTGWYTSPETSEGTKYNEFTNYEVRGNMTLYAHWQEGVTTIIFENGSNDDGQTGNCDETYRNVRYLENYGRRAAEDPLQDELVDLPLASVPGRVFMGWYFTAEPKMSNGFPDEVDQTSIKEVISRNAASASISKNTNTFNFSGVATSGAGSLSSGYNRQTQWKVESDKGHMLYAHYLDNRYSVVYNPQYPTGATKETSSAYTGINGSHVVTGMTFPTKIVKNGYTMAISWDPTRLATDNSSIAYEGSTDSFPDLNASNWNLDNFYFKGWYYNSNLTSALANTSDEVPKKTYGTDNYLSYGDSINLYGKWIGKEVLVEFYYDTSEPALLRGGNMLDSDPTKVVSGQSITYQNGTASGDVRKFLSSYYTRTTAPQYATTMATKVNESDPGNNNLDTTTAFPTTLNINGYNYLDANGNVSSTVHWFSEPECINEVKATDTMNTMKYGYSGNSRIENTIKLYAKLSPKTVTVSFDANGGSVSQSSKTVTYTGTYGTLPTPTRTGYKFVGWYESTTRGYGAGYMFARVTNESTVLTYTNHTLYAAWVSYEFNLQTSDTQTSVTNSIYTERIDNVNYTRSTYSYSNRAATYTITPAASDGVYKRSGGSAFTLTGDVADINATAVCFTYRASQVPSTLTSSNAGSLTYSRNNSTGAWTISGWAVYATADYVNDAEIDYTISRSGTNRGDSQDPHISNNSTAWANKSSSTNYRSSRLYVDTGSGSSSYHYVYMTPEKPGSTSITIFDDRYYGSKAAANAADPVNSSSGANSSARVTTIFFTCNGDLASSGLSIYQNITLLIVQAKNNEYTAVFNPTTTHESQRNLTWSLPTKPTGDSHSTVKASSTPYSTLLDVGYKTGTLKLRVTSDFNTGTYAEITITIEDPGAGSVSVASGTTNKFTDVVEKSITGSGGSTGRLIPTSKCITGFYIYGSGSTTTIDFSYTNSTDHDVWLIPIDETGANTAGSNFQAPTGKKYIAYPDNVTKISANNLGTSVKAVYIPSSVTEILAGTGSGTSAGTFKGCTNLVDFVVKGTNLKTVGAYAFYGCTNTSLEFPSTFIGSLTSVGNYAFYNCKGLSGEQTFNNCTFGSQALRYTKITELTLNGSCSVGEYLCAGSTCLDTLYLGGTTYIGESAFEETHLTTVTIPSSVTSMGSCTFTDCDYMTSCTIACETLGSYAFEYCDSLEEIEFKSTARNTGYYAFAYCPRLSQSDITWGGITTIGDGSFEGATIAGNLTLPSGIQTIGTNAFKEAGGINNLTIPATVSLIEEHAFHICEDITSVTFLETTAFEIEYEAFASCYSLETVDFLALGSHFPEMTMGSDVWYGDTNITYVKIARSSFGSSITGKTTTTASDFDWTYSKNSMGFVTSATADIYLKAPAYVKVYWYNYMRECHYNNDCGARGDGTVTGHVDSY